MIEQLERPEIQTITPTDEVSPAELRRIFAAQQAHRWTMAQTTAVERISRLKRLRASILAHREQLYAAMEADFGKHLAEVELTEIQPTLRELSHVIKHLPRWMRARRVSSVWFLAGTRSAIRYEPRGVVLILAPWNYPFSLLINPLIAAIAAGNCAIVRPSEKVPHTARVLASIIAATFEEREVALVAGGVETADRLLELPFDHIFFTGSTRVGQKVMAAAARHLASVTLELGGKSPAIVDADADIRQAAERIIWGKCINAGQTCVAPDYVLVHESRAAAFTTAAREVLTRFYGAADAERRANRHFCRLIDRRSYERLTDLLDNAVAGGARIVVGGDHDPDERYLAPTLLADVTADSPLMAEEIFGPLLPVLTYRTLDEAIALVNAKPKPLAMYIFSSQRPVVDRIVQQTSAGGTVVNNVVVHLAHPGLPFGGVGASGQGSYHGWFGFRAFSHERAVMAQQRVHLTRLFYPPYSRMMRGVLKLVGWLS
ncbi:MAG TPA: aldehyde dehydrogenase family protein [Herpetosiphonaceae bacterium]